MQVALQLNLGWWDASLALAGDSEWKKCKDESEPKKKRDRGAGLEWDPTEDALKLEDVAAENTRRRREYLACSAGPPAARRPVLANSGEFGILESLGQDW